MKHCTNCGHELEAGAKFCPNCGQATSVSEQVAEDGRASDATLTHQVSSDTDHEKTDEQVTPRIPEQQQPTTKSTKTQNNTVIAIALVVLVILGGFFFVKNRVVVSRDRLASNITKAVQKQDGKLFLKQFSKDD